MSLVVVAGAVANKLNLGGEAWVRLSYLLGLRRLGYRVHFLEQISEHTCVDSRGWPAAFEQSENRAYFNRVMEQFDLFATSTLVPTDREGKAILPSWLFDLADSSAVLLNISGHLTLAPLLARFRRKVFIDLDPGFTQFWHAEGNANTGLAGHDDYFTIASNIGRTGCGIPLGEIPWRTTRPPVVLDEWPSQPPVNTSRFTTVANWRGSFGPVTRDGTVFGLKVHEFRKYISLPSFSSAEFEVALNIHPDDDKDLQALEGNGWHVANPLAAAGTPDCFRRYIQASGAEFSVAQGIYVQTNSGWFSDRTTRYLASGRPVLVQDTGFSRHLPSQLGLLTFATLAEAIAGVESILSDYDAHAQAARAIAEQYFDSALVLSQLMDDIGIAP